MRSPIRESHSPGAFPRLWGKSVRTQPPPAPREGNPALVSAPEQRPGQVGGCGCGCGEWVKQCGDGAGVSGSPAAKSRTVQGITPPAFGQAIWLRPAWPMAHNPSCEAREGKGEAGPI